MKVDLIRVKRDDHGFEAFQVRVNGVIVHTHMGEREARLSYMRLCGKLGIQLQGTTK